MSENQKSVQNWRIFQMKATLMQMCVEECVKSEKMGQLTNDQHVWICLEFARVGNAAEVQRRWPKHFPQRPLTSLPAIRKNAKKLNEEATCHNLNKGRSGRRRTAVTQQNVNMVRNSLQNDGKRSSRRNGLGLSATSKKII